MENLMGYIRADGRVGLRNHVICVATVMCATAVVEGISKAVPEIIPVIHTDGCETRRVKTLYFTKTLENLCRHPNNYAVMLVGLGCERDNAKEIAGRLQKEGIRVWASIIQEDGGCKNVIHTGVAQARRFLAEAAEEKPVPVSLPQLTVGVETDLHIKREDPFGGSNCTMEDNTKAEHMAENVALTLSAQGATVILPSIYGKKPAMENGTGIATIKYADQVPCDGRIYAIDQDGDRWKGREDGVFNMDVSESLLSMCASGAQLLILCTGGSLPLGFPMAPLIKYVAGKDAIGEADVCGYGEEIPFDCLMSCVVDVASGKPTFEEDHNDCGDLICTYRRTNIY